jgi:hypothetical protein
MWWSSGARRGVPTFSIGVLALAVIVLLPVVSASASIVTSSAKPSGSHRPKLVQVGYGRFWECPSKTTKLLVAVNTLTLHSGSTLRVNFVVRNLSPRPCNYVAPSAGVASGSMATVLSAGPCGSIGFDVVGPGRHDVWPGPAVFNCPALGFAQLQPDGSVSGSGTWAGNKPNSKAHVATGRYTLVVNGHFRFPLRVVGRAPRG